MRPAKQLQGSSHFSPRPWRWAHLSSKARASSRASSTNRWRKRNRWRGFPPPLWKHRLGNKMEDGDVFLLKHLGSWRMNGLRKTCELMSNPTPTCLDLERSASGWICLSLNGANPLYSPFFDQPKIGSTLSGSNRPSYPYRCMFTGKLHIYMGLTMKTGGYMWIYIYVCVYI